MTTRKKAQTTRRIFLSVGRARQEAESEKPEKPEKPEEEVAQPQRRTRRPKGEPKEQKEVKETEEVKDEAKEKVQKRRGRQPKSVMGPADIEKCTHLTVELISDNYSFGFRTTLSEEQSNEYNNAVQAPMDLATVLENLRRGAYTTRKEWQNDVNSIWQNALGYHKVNAMYYVAANVMKQKFAKMVEELDMSEEELWLRKVVRQLQKLDEIDCA